MNSKTETDYNLDLTFQADTKQSMILQAPVWLYSQLWRRGGNARWCQVSPDRHHSKWQNGVPRYMWRAPLKMAPTRLEGDVCKKEVLRLKYWRLLKKKNWRLFLRSDEEVERREWSLIFQIHGTAGLREEANSTDSCSNDKSSQALR